MQACLDQLYVGAHVSCYSYCSWCVYHWVDSEDTFASTRTTCLYDRLHTHGCHVWPTERLHRTHEDQLYVMLVPVAIAINLSLLPSEMMSEIPSSRRQWNASMIGCICRCNIVPTERICETQKDDLFELLVSVAMAINIYLFLIEMSLGTP